MSNLLVQNIKHTNGTTAQTVDSSGRIFTSENRPHLFARGWGAVSSSQATLNGQTMDSDWGVHHTYDEVTENYGNHFDNSTGLFRFPITGLYFLSCGFGMKAASNYVGMSLVMGTSSDHGTRGLIETWSNSGSSSEAASISCFKNCTAGNDACLFLREGTYTYPATAVEFCWLNITFVG